MQTLKAATVVFCTACICAELVAQMTGSDWARRCIKAVAGLYILVVLLQALPQIRADIQSFTVPETASVEFGTLEQLILAEQDARAAAQGQEGGEPSA